MNNSNQEKVCPSCNQVNSIFHQFCFECGFKFTDVESGKFEIIEDKEYRTVQKEDILTLDLSGKEIMDITEISGLEALTDLQILKLSNNQIGEIKGLETLKNLLKLDLRGNEISEIKGLKNLSNLIDLDLSYNKIREIQGLNNLINLKRLNLKGNLFVTIKGLENLIKLKHLNLGLSHWEVDNVKPMERPRHTLVLNGKELTGVERYVVKGGAKKVVAYCRVKLRQSGYAEKLVPADSKIKRLEGQIENVIKKYEKKIKKVKNKQLKKEIIRKDQRYFKEYGAHTMR
ncbi:MAG: leucine-rich repeat domain-containing protein [Candidatus Hermodarchaeota archaeon]